MWQRFELAILSTSFVVWVLCLVQKRSIETQCNYHSEKENDGVFFFLKTKYFICCWISLGIYQQTNLRFPLLFSIFFNELFQKHVFPEDEMCVNQGILTKQGNLVIGSIIKVDTFA